MKLFRNIPNGYKLFRSVGIFNKHMPAIAAAREAGDFEDERAQLARWTGIWANNVIDMYDWKVNITGQENIPKNQPCVFISNHQGYADIIVMFKAAEGKQIGFMAKDSLKNVPYFGKWIHAIRGVFLKRGNARESLSSIKDGVDLLKNGFSLVIFPEGTRSHGKQMAEFKAGSFKLATRAKVPVVPVTINGSYEAFEVTGVISKNANIDVVIHPPIDTASLDRHQTANITHEVEAMIRASLEELVAAREGKKEKEK